MKITTVVCGFAAVAAAVAAVGAEIRRISNNPVPTIPNRCEHQGGAIKFIKTRNMAFGGERNEH